MAYTFNFAWIASYTPILIEGVLTTIGLSIVGTLGGLLLGLCCAWTMTFGPHRMRPLVTGYVEVIRNTPFLIQLFFIFFGLPQIGVSISAMVAAVVATVINVGAYSSEIIRAGIAATPTGQIDAGRSLAMTRYEVFRHVVLLPALQRIWPALSSQFVIVMLGSAVVSQIAVEDITFAATFIASRNFRNFETYLVSLVIYLLLAIALRALLDAAGRRLFVRRTARG